MADRSISFSLPPHWQAWIAHHVTIERVLWILTTVLFLVAWNRGLHLLYAMFSFLLAALLLSHAGARWQLRKLGGALHIRREIHAGREENAQIVLQGSGTHYLLGVRLPDGRENIYRSSAALFEEFTATAHRAITITFYRRGKHTLDHLAVTSCYPFGLVKIGRKIQISPVECIVYPRAWPLRQLPIQHLLGSQLDGDIPQHQQKGEEEFAMVRSYRDGDEMRHIHWRMSAKYQDWVVKEFDSTRLPAMAVILNTNPGWIMQGNFDPREQMLEVVASLANKCAQDGVGLLVVLDPQHSYQVTPFQRDLQPLLYKLALWQGEPFDANTVLAKLQGCPLVIRFSCTADGKVQPLPLMAHQHQIDIRFDHNSYAAQAMERPVKKSSQGRSSLLLVSRTSPLWDLF